MQTLKSLTSTLRPGTRYRYIQADVTVFGFQSNAYIHLEWKKHPNSLMSEKVEGISNQIFCSCIFHSGSGASSRSFVANYSSQIFSVLLQSLSSVLFSFFLTNLLESTLMLFKSIQEPCILGLLAHQHVFPYSESLL